MSPPLITLFTDASYCHKTHAAGWGMWARSFVWKHPLFKGGQIQHNVSSSAEAELWAISHALCVLEDRKRILQEQRLMVQSDCMRALAILRDGLGATDTAHSSGLSVDQNCHFITPIEQEALWVIQNVRDTYGLDLCVRHVKGHSDGDGRSWVNRTCDIIARKHMRAQQSHFLQGNPCGLSKHQTHEIYQ